MRRSWAASAPIRAAVVTKVRLGRHSPPRPRGKLLPKPAALPARTRDDREFLPAALEIIETPASPAGVLFLWLLCAAMATLVGWSVFARLDIYAVAPGRLQIAGRSKVVQSLEPGRVVAISVKNGDRVAAGQRLIDLESTELGADVAEQTLAIAALDAEILGRQAAIHAARTHEATLPPLAFPKDMPGDIRERTAAARTAELDHLASARASLEAQIDENAALLRRTQMSMEARGRLVSTLKERIDMRQELVDRGAGMRAAVLDALQSLQTEETSLAQDRGQAMQAEAEAIVLARKLDQATSEFIDGQSEKLEQADRKRDWAREDLVKARAKALRAHLTAPIAGTVQQLAVTTIGQVVGSGEPLLLIVPSDGALEVEALVSNADVGFIKRGQDVTIKVDAFPFTGYGTIVGKVARISGEAVDAHEAAGSADVTDVARGRGIGAVAAMQAAQNLLFPVTIALPRTTVDPRGIEAKLLPGMTVSVEIRTGDRRAIDYLLSPLRVVTGSAAHER